MKQWLMFCFGCFIVGTALSCLISGRWLLNGEMNIINALGSFNAVNVQTAGTWTIAKQITNYWDAITTALSWDYPYLNNTWGAMFKVFPLSIFSIGAVVGFVELFAQVASGALTAIRSLIP